MDTGKAGTDYASLHLHRIFSDGLLYTSGGPGSGRDGAGRGNGSAGNASGDSGRRSSGNVNDCKDRRRDRGKRI